MGDPLRGQGTDHQPQGPLRGTANTWLVLRSRVRPVNRVKPALCHGCMAVVNREQLRRVSKAKPAGVSSSDVDPSARLCQSDRRCRRICEAATAVDRWLLVVATTRSPAWALTTSPNQFGNETPPGLSVLLWGASCVLANSFWSLLHSRAFSSPSGLRALSSSVPCAPSSRPRTIRSSASSSIGTLSFKLLVRTGSPVVTLTCTRKARASRDWFRARAPRGISKRESYAIAAQARLLSEFEGSRQFPLQRPCCGPY